MSLHGSNKREGGRDAAPPLRLRKPNPALLPRGSRLTVALPSPISQPRHGTASLGDAMCSFPGLPSPRRGVRLAVLRQRESPDLVYLATLPLWSGWSQPTRPRGPQCAPVRPSMPRYPITTRQLLRSTGLARGKVLACSPDASLMSHPPRPPRPRWRTGLPPASSTYRGFFVGSVLALSFLPPSPAAQSLRRTEVARLRGWLAGCRVLIWGSGGAGGREGDEGRTGHGNMGMDGAWGSLK